MFGIRLVVLEQVQASNYHRNPEKVSTILYCGSARELTACRLTAMARQTWGVCGAKNSRKHSLLRKEAAKVSFSRGMNFLLELGLFFLVDL